MSSSSIIQDAKKELERISNERKQYFDKSRLFHEIHSPQCSNSYSSPVPPLYSPSRSISMPLSSSTDRSQANLKSGILKYTLHPLIFLKNYTSCAYYTNCYNDISVFFVHKVFGVVLRLIPTLQV